MELRLRNKNGFTIVELLIVIVVIGILAALVIVAYTGITRASYETSVKSDVRNGASALAVARAGNDAYPAACSDAGVKASQGNTLLCQTSASQYCISVSRNDIYYFATHVNQTPQVGTCSGLVGVPGPVTVATVPTAQFAKLLASDGASNDFFGSSVAMSGNTVVVGAWNEDSSGAAYVYTRSGSAWTQQAKLVASDRANYDVFGTSVAIDGDTVAAGASGDNSGIGSAYVYTRSGSTWTQQAKIGPADNIANTGFGNSAAIVGDTVVMGSYNEQIGSAYVFTRSGSAWTQQAKLVASDGTAGNYFGYSVSMSGETIAVGAYNVDSVYVFTRSGTSWTQQAKLLASDGVMYDYFGSSVSIAGNTVVVGAPYDDNESGSAYIFTRTGFAWTQMSKFTAGDAAAYDSFGTAVAVGESAAIIGAPRNQDFGTNSGSIYMFE